MYNTPIIYEEIKGDHLPASWVYAEVSAAPTPTPPRKSLKKFVPFDDIIFKNYSGDTGDLYKVAGIELPKQSTTTQIPQDKLTQQVWSELFFLTPPKKGAIVGATKGSGNGEVAMYWFLKQFQTNNVCDNRYHATGCADIIVNGRGVEVKAYDVNSAEIKIGKFRSAGKFEGKHNNITLNTLLGLHSLLNGIYYDHDVKKAPSDPANFSCADLLIAFTTLRKVKKVITSLHSVFTLDELNSDYDVIKHIYDNVNHVYAYLGDTKTDNELSLQLMWNFLRAKLSEKPGPGGVIVNTRSNGQLEWFCVPDDIHTSIIPPAWFNEKTATVRSGEIFINRSHVKV